MDHMKHALKKKMGKHVMPEIHIHIESPDKKDELDKTTDLAPDVKDSQEAGPDDYTNALIAQAPDHPAGGKTLDSIAKERAMRKMGAKKG